MILVGAEGVMETGGIINKVSYIFILTHFLADWHLNSCNLCKIYEQTILCNDRKYKVCKRIPFEPIRYP